MFKTKLSSLALLAAVVFAPAMGQAATVDAVASPTLNVGNCIPFGCSTYGPSAFVYKNIDAFEAQAGDTLSFDVAVPSSVDFDFDIYFGATTTNGGAAVNSGDMVKVVSRGDAGGNRGNNVVGDFDLEFTLTDDFSFAGGGFVIQFVGFHTATNGAYGLVGANNGNDASGKFVCRSYRGTAGQHSACSDTSHIGNFRLEASGGMAPVPVAPALPLMLSGLAMFGLARRRR